MIIYGFRYRLDFFFQREKEECTKQKERILLKNVNQNVHRRLTTLVLEALTPSPSHNLSHEQAYVRFSCVRASVSGCVCVCAFSHRLSCCFPPETSRGTSGGMPYWIQSACQQCIHSSTQCVLRLLSSNAIEFCFFYYPYTKFRKKKVFFLYIFDYISNDLA